MGRESEEVKKTIEIYLIGRGTVTMLYYILSQWQQQKSRHAHRLSNE